MDIGTTLILEMNNSYCTFDPVTGEERIFFACEIDVDAGYKFAEARFEIIIPENPAPAFFTLINVIEECEPFILERTDTDQFRVYDDEAPLRFCSIVNLKFWDDDLDALNPEVQEATDLSRPRMLADVEEVVGC